MHIANFRTDPKATIVDKCRSWGTGQFPIVVSYATSTRNRNQLASNFQSNFIFNNLSMLSRFNSVITIFDIYRSYHFDKFVCSFKKPIKIWDALVRMARVIAMASRRKMPESWGGPKGESQKPFNGIYPWRGRGRGGSSKSVSLFH